MGLLYIDLETYSEVDLAKCGVYTYAAHPSFEILLLSYAYDDGPVNTVDVKRLGEIPQDIVNALTKNTVIKIAHNAAFEMTCLSKYLTSNTLRPEQWRCSMVHAMMAGLPASLEKLSEILLLSKEEGKIDGKSLIRYFCTPCSPTAKNGGRTRNLPEHDPSKWEAFKIYSNRDVKSERIAYKKILKLYTVSELEQSLWNLDQSINRKGVLVDLKLVDEAINFDSRFKKELEKEATQLADIDNINSVAQLKEWLGLNGEEVDSLSKETVEKLIGSTDSDKIKQLLKIRQQLSKTSVKKYYAMRNAATDDGRIKGLFQYYGASRTGRWAGRLVQVQNLPKPQLTDSELDLAREILISGDYKRFEMLFDVSDTLSQLIRTAFIAPEDHSFVVADFSAIEARIVSWLADEKWRNYVFATHGKIYEASASQMFHVPINKITKDLRARGKVAELALGYQGGVSALIRMGALDKGILESELIDIVHRWRRANQNIVALWSKIENSAINAIKIGSFRYKNLLFKYKYGNLYITLPSGRDLTYYRTSLKDNRISYYGIDQTKKIWCSQDTYGGKLVENITQAIARDCLAEAMLNLDNVVMHIHDEVVIEVNDKDNLLNTVAYITKVMKSTPSWAPGLKLDTSILISKYYKKD